MKAYTYRSRVRLHRYVMLRNNGGGVEQCRLGAVSVKKLGKQTYIAFHHAIILYKVSP